MLGVGHSVYPSHGLVHGVTSAITPSLGTTYVQLSVTSFSEGTAAIVILESSTIFFTSEVIGGLLACCLASQYFTPQIGYLLLILYLLSLVDIFHTALYPVPMVLAFMPLFIDYWPTNHWLSALLIGSTLSVINYFSDGIGTGDIELLAILGLWFGLEVTLSMLLIACLLCLIKYLIDSLHHPVVLALVGRRPIPFVPYISYGVLIVLFIANT